LQKGGKGEATKPNFLFVTNIFHGEMETSQLVPYPEALNAEQLEYIGAFVDPVTKFFTASYFTTFGNTLLMNLQFFFVTQEVNDPAKSDTNAQTDLETLEQC
jgi:hypothetical protein